jgi:hypothetical protein
MTPPNAIRLSPAPGACYVQLSDLWPARSAGGLSLLSRSLAQPLTLVWIGVRASMSIVAAVATGRLGSSK